MLRSRLTSGFIIALLLFATVAAFAPSINRALAATTYTSLTYDGQINVSFTEVYGSMRLSGTPQLTFTLTLDKSSSLHGAGNIQGGIKSQGTFSGTYTESRPYSYCASTYQITATYTTFVSGYTSFETDTVDLSGGTISNYVETISPEIPPGYGCKSLGAEGDLQNILISCFSSSEQQSVTNRGCDKFPIQGGSQTIAKGPSTDCCFESISGTAQLTLVSSQTSTTTTSSTTSFTTTTSTSSTATTTPTASCDLTGFGVQLIGIRTGPADAYVTRVSEGDTFIIDGKFFQPAIPLDCGLTIDVRVTVTLTGADGVPINYGAPVTGSLGAQPTPDVPTTWLTLAPPAPPLHRPLGLWQALASAQITLSSAAGTQQVGPIFSDVLTFLVESSTPSVTLQAAFPNGLADIPVYGNITEITQADVVDTNGLYTLKFNATGPTDSVGHMTLVIAKNLIPTRWTPAVMVNGIRIPVSYQTPQLVSQCSPALVTCAVAAFSQDDDNYYIRIMMHFSTDSVEIDFVPPKFSSGQSASLVLGQPDFASNGYYVCQSCLAAPHGIAFDQSGNLWVADSASNRVVRFSPPFSDGMDANLVIGQSNFTAVGSSTSQSGLYAPVGLAFDPSGNLWVSDLGNSRILQFRLPFTAGMSASLVIGQPDFVSAAASTTQSGLFFPQSIAFDSSGSLWATDTSNSRVLRFSPPFSNGMMASRVIGQQDFTSNEFATTQAGLRAPTGIAFDTAGNLWIADFFNNRTLQFTAPFVSGMAASLVLGQSSFTASAVCVASQSTMCFPVGVAFDEPGTLWVADGANNRILEFAPPFASGMRASSVIGQPDFSSTAGGTSATELFLASGEEVSVTNVAFDPSGNLWIGDSRNNRVIGYSPNPASIIPEFSNVALVLAASVFMIVAVLTIVRRNASRPAGTHSNIS